MRFNNRFCALMDIPDLPQGAFEHIGDRKIKPQGGGGGIVSAITDPISSALGTDGGGGGVLGGLAAIDPGPALGSAAAAIDPGPAIGNVLEEVDKGVNQIPGGWYTVGGLAAGGTALYFAPEIMAAVGAEAGTAITTEAGKEAFFGALANGATGAEAVSTGLAAESALGAGALTTDQILGSTGFTPTPGSSFVVDPNAVYTAGSATQGAPVYDFSEPLYPPQAGPTYQELGVTGVEGGMAGPTYGELGYTGLNQAEAIAAADAASAAATAATKISPLQAVQGLKMASGLLNSGQQATPAGATAQFRGSSVPQGAVDYSGILNLLQTRAQQRNPYSLLG